MDLYGQQIGARLEDVASFAKSVGGCPANIAIGTARLGLKSAWSGTGRRRAVRALYHRADGARGRIHRRDHGRSGAADGAGHSGGRGRQDVSADFLSRKLRRHGADGRAMWTRISSRAPSAVLVTGTHFSRAQYRAAQEKAMAIAREKGSRSFSISIIDPTCGGWRAMAAGEERYIESDTVFGAAKAGLAPLRSYRGHRRRNPDRFGRDRSEIRAQNDPIPFLRRDRSEARTHGVHRL